MLAFPNAKINLGLHIERKREDGFHDLQTVFYPIPVYDVLEFIPAKGKAAFTHSGLAIPGKEKDNLVWKAYEMLRKAFDLPALHIHLYKNIPMGAGLGGGSADAAFMLELLDREFNLFLGAEYLESLAAELGSDCAFFIRNAPALATGRGEILEPIDFSLKGYHGVLIAPEIHISTAEAYRNVTPAPAPKPLTEILPAPISDWKNALVNDFENSLFPQYPELAEIKDKLYEAGALYASMSGSGSSFFGIFKEVPELAAFKKLGRVFGFEF